jgi:uncharacterized membrane protein YkvA (DUF1232 family)
MPDEPTSNSSLRRLLPDTEPVRERMRALVPRLKARTRLLRRRLRERSAPSESPALDDLDEDYVRDGARAVTETDLDTVVEEADAIEERFRAPDGPLRRLLEDGRLLLSLVRDVRRGRYRRVPVWTASAAAFALLYVLNPFDVMPDALPVVGLLDDAAVVSACLALLEQDLHAYREWRRRGNGRPDSFPPQEHEEKTSG